MSIDTNRSLLVDTQSAGPSLVSNSPNLFEGRTITVVRLRNGKAVSIEPDEGTELYASDTVKVEKNLMSTKLPEIGPKLIKSNASED